MGVVDWLLEYPNHDDFHTLMRIRSYIENSESFFSRRREQRHWSKVKLRAARRVHDASQARLRESIPAQPGDATEQPRGCAGG